MSTDPEELTSKADTEIRRLDPGAGSVPDVAERSRAAMRQERLAFPPIYVLVGAYRLATDKSLYVPMWQKCKHGFVRGAIVGVAWVRVSSTWRIATPLMFPSCRPL